MPRNNNFSDKISNITVLSGELRDIAFNIKNTNPKYYGNDGFEHGRVRFLDDSGQTRYNDAATLIKVADLFEQFFCTAKNNC